MAEVDEWAPLFSLLATSVISGSAELPLTTTLCLLVTAGDGSASGGNLVDAGGGGFSAMDLPQMCPNAGIILTNSV